jgi:hypothetical protein
MSDKVDHRSALMRIEDLERVVTMLYGATAEIKNATENLLRMQGDVGLLKEALKLLNRKTEAIVLLSKPESGVTAQAVSDVVTKMNVEDLKAQTAAYLANGQIAPADEVAANSFVVCEEYSTDGALANPRIQFRLDSQDKATADTLLGKKVGDTVSFGEGKFSAKIVELYSLVPPKAPEAAAPAAAAPATDDEATSADNSTGDATPATTATADAAPASPTAAPTGPVNATLDTPAETPVTQFVSDDGSVTATA